MSEQAPARPRYGYWLFVSIPVALALDVVFGGLARFSWCGFNTCLYKPGDPSVSITFLVVIGVVSFLALALPPWIPGWRRPVISAAAGLVAAAVTSLLVFQPR